MIDTYTDPKSVPSLATIADDVREGLPGDLDRMRRARLNEDYYQLRNAQHIPRRPAEEDLDYQARPKLTSKITRKAIRTLANPLYKSGPARTVGASAEADAWLQRAYAAAHVNNRLASANRAAILNGVAALQVDPTGRPERPFKLWLWKAHEFAVYTLDGDPETPWAVVVRDTIPDRPGFVRARYRAWSAAEVRTWISDPFGKHEPSIGRKAPIPVQYDGQSGPTPYPGVLPFVFVRNEPAECEFWGGGIGDALRECNAEMDRELSDIAQHLMEFLNPRLFLRNVSIATRFLERIGAFIHLKGSPNSDAQKTVPEAFALQVQLGVEAAWYHLKNYADQTIEELDIPLTSIRSDASTDLSGVAIIAKQVPMVDYTRERQVLMNEPEADLACKSLAVCGTRDSLAGGSIGAGLQGAAADAQFTCVWPEPSIPLPTVERDEQDQAELEMGLTDHIEVLAKRRNLTLDQAEEMAQKIAERERRWQEIRGDLDEEAPDPNAPGEPAEGREPTEVIDDGEGDRSETDE